jgi:outer membrane immunogenic protein
VIGAEADFQGAGIRDSFTRTIDAAGDVLNAKMNINYFGTLRGRLGFAFDRALIYATGGLAYADVNETLFVSNPAVAANANLTNNSVKFGGAIGGGVEYALTGNWSVKAEYQYIALAKASGLAAPVVPAGGGTIVSNAISDSFHTVRLGANYKF